MPKVIIITGEHNTGKSLLAKKLANNRRAVWLESYQIKNRFSFSQLNKKTELIVIDELSHNHLNDFINLITSNTIMVERQGFDPIQINIPEIIAVSNSIIKEDFKRFRNVSIIEL